MPLPVMEAEPSWLAISHCKKSKINGLVVLWAKDIELAVDRRVSSGTACRRLARNTCLRKRSAYSHVIAVLTQCWTKTQ